jgi:1-acyl-sn-glycerol-3-phosphate acyltransferase
MIPARKNKSFEAWFARHVAGRVHGELQRVQIAGASDAQAALEAAPVLLVSNHTSWWDVMFAVYVAHRVLRRCDAFAMMDAANLRKLPFFARIGAFGVERAEAGQGFARDSIDYAAGLLAAPGRLVWVFPQGDERPAMLRPLGFRRGAAVVAHARPDALIVPLGFHYALERTAKPCAYLSFGPPVPRGETVEATTAAMEAAVEAQLDRIAAHLCAGPDGGFVTVHKARPGRIERFAEWALARFNRRHARPAVGAESLPPPVDPTGALPPPASQLAQTPPEEPRPPEG